MGTKGRRDSQTTSTNYEGQATFTPDPETIAANEASKRGGNPRTHATPTPSFQPRHSYLAHSDTLGSTAKRSRPYVIYDGGGSEDNDSNHQDEIGQRRT